MPITHTTIPVPPAKVGETEWAEAHTLPTAAEVGALTTASADARYVIGSAGDFLTPGSASSIYLLQQDASTVYARQVSAVTTAQLGVYLLSQDASTTYARQTSAVTTAQLSIYLTQSSANSQFANLASAVTTAQLAVYLLSQDASTTYARQASAVTTAQLAIYLLANDASTTYARQASAVTTAQLSIYLTSGSAAAIYLTSASASTVYARQVSALTTAQGNAAYALISHTHAAGDITTGIMAPARLGSATPDSTVYLRGDGQWAAVVVSTLNITEASSDAKYGVTKVVTADTSSATIATLITIPELILSVSGSVAYDIQYNLVYRSSAATTGIGVLVSCTPTPGVFAVCANIYGFAADGAAAVYDGYASANGDIILGTSVNAAAIDLPITINGTIVTGAAGQIQLAFRSEVANSNVVIRRGSSVRLTRLGAV